MLITVSLLFGGCASPLNKPSAARYFIVSRTAPGDSFVDTIREFDYDVKVFIPQHVTLIKDKPDNVQVTLTIGHVKCVYETEYWEAGIASFKGCTDGTQIGGYVNLNEGDKIIMHVEDTDITVLVVASCPILLG